ncbi:helix-turn-helix domain-containing protein [Staphylospora marina]|uniref:helix-turn-helix domain-containing protein n=1 Tax=Staphylospora marina TaxID=2490858 RepID=UPI0013DDF76C|nr:RodZ domain-containing protein [Staphylospora marina]
MSVEIGSYLRQAREALGMTLDQVQEKTKIQKSFLIAIENGEFHKLPSPFYVRTYLRSYANCVKVEPHHILRQYRKIDQAERMTGVHKAVTENDLSQTGRFPGTGTLKMPAVGPGSGPLRGVSQDPRQPAAGRSMPRTSVNTALTAAKSETSKLQIMRDREMVRRDLGYQRNTGLARPMPHGPQIPNPVQPEVREKPDLSATGRVPLPSEPATNQRQATFPDMHAGTLPPRRPREQGQPNSVRPPAGGPLPNMPKRSPGPDTSPESIKPSSPGLPPLADQEPLSTNPAKPVADPALGRGLTRSTGSHAPVTGTSGVQGSPGGSPSAGSLSRSARIRQERNTLPPEPGALAAREAAAGEGDPSAHDPGFPTTPRRSATRKQSKDASGSPMKRKAVAAVAALILCGSIGWGVMSVLGNESESKSNVDQSKNNTSSEEINTDGNNEKSAQKVQPASKGTLEPAQKGANTNHYRLKGTDQLTLEFEVPSGSCWIEIRGAQASGTDKLKEATLKSGQKWEFKHVFTDNPDLWITFGQPESVVVKANGTFIDPAVNVHIKKSTDAE